MGNGLFRRILIALRLPVLLLVVLPCCSCSRNETPLFPVRGSVSFNGLPAAKALIIFHTANDPSPTGVKPRAIAARDGTFLAFTNVAGDGVPAGDYIVTIVGDRTKASTKPANSAKKKAESSAHVLPPRYADPKSSGLRVTIQKGDNDLPPFDLKAK